jgi:hypothetical protein
MASTSVQIAEALEIVRAAGFEILYSPDDGEFAEQSLTIDQIKEEVKKVQMKMHSHTALSVAETLKRSGYLDISDYLAATMMGEALSIACCRFVCDVEPDGHCKHGNPSIELQFGML